MKALIVATDRGNKFDPLTRDTTKALIPILGVPLIERMIRTCKAAGIKEYVIVLGYLGERIEAFLGNGERLRIKINYIENKERKKGNGDYVLKAKEFFDENFLVMMSDYIVDARILKGLVNHYLRGTIVLAVNRREPLEDDTKVFEKDGNIGDLGKDIVESNCIDTGIFLCSPEIFSYLDNSKREGKAGFSEGINLAVRDKNAEAFDITSINSYVTTMRKEIKPFCININEKDDIIRAEKLLLENACKGTNDFLATYVNKYIENFLVKRAARTAITPNQISILTNIIAYVSTFLFFCGYLLPASLLTFIVSFMDGVDGKLSRIKISSSHIGKMEHAFDFLFEHSWYIALGLYLSKTHGIISIVLATLVLLHDGFSHYCQQAFADAKNSHQLVDFGKLEKKFRRFDGRKNSYIIFILFGVILHMPYYSLIAITCWSFISAAFYCLRVMKHLHVMDQKETL